MKTKNLVILALLSVVGSLAYAAGPAPAFGAADTVLNFLQSAMAPAIDKLTKQAISMLAVLASLQFFMTNYSIIKSDGDIQTVIAKAAGSIAWVSICLYLINNGPQFITGVGAQMFDVLGFALPTPGSIIASTVKIVGTLAAIAVGLGGIGIIGSPIAGQLLLYILLAIAAIGMFFAFKIFMIQLEVGLVAMLSPLSFAFLGLNALKDQGIAPFKALISLVYRILLLSVFLSAFTEVSDVANAAIKGMTADSISQGIGKALDAVLSALCAYILLAYLVYKSDAIAATLAGGQTSMGPGDVASAAAAGAAAGAAIASGGASLAGAGASAPVAMADFMKSLGGGGSVSNASTRGAGASPVGTAPIPPATPSSPYPTRKDGSPIAPANTSTPGAKAGPSPDGAPPSSTPGKAAADSAKAPESTTPPPTGSGSTAGIGGANGEPPKANMDDVLKAVGQLGQGNKKSLGDHLASANQQISQEKAATHVSINTHQSD